jgi:hypothetical protein
MPGRIYRNRLHVPVQLFPKKKLSYGLINNFYLFTQQTLKLERFMMLANWRSPSALDYT